MKCFLLAIVLLGFVSGCGQPKSAAECVDLAFKQFNEQDYESALRLCDRAISLEPNSCSGYNMRAIVYGALGDFDASIADWTRAIELSPDDATKSVMYTMRSCAYEGRGDSLNVAKDRAMAKKLESTADGEK